MSLRKKNDLKINKGSNTFLKKWGISIKFFKKFYLKTNTKYYGPLDEPKKSLDYLLNYLITKLHYYIIKIFK